MDVEVRSVSRLRGLIKEAKAARKPPTVINKLIKELKETQKRKLESVKNTPLTPAQKKLMTRLSKSKTSGVKKMPPTQTKAKGGAIKKYKGGAMKKMKGY